MSIKELLNTIQYVTDNEGNRKAVLFDLAVWEEVVARLEEAEQKDKAVEQVETDEAWEEAMAREEAAYRAMHRELCQRYAGQHVAIYDGKLVDHDEDATALYLRIRRKYPNTFVLITPVHSEQEETYVMRSPRLVSEA